MATGKWIRGCPTTMALAVVVLAAYSASADDKTYHVDCNAQLTSSCQQNSETWPFVSIEEALDCIAGCWTPQGPCDDWTWTIKVKPGEISASGLPRVYGPQVINATHRGATITLRRWGDSGPKPTIRLTDPEPWQHALKVVRPHVIVDSFNLECEGCRAPYTHPATLDYSFDNYGVMVVGQAFEVNTSVISNNRFDGFDVGIDAKCVGNEGVLIEGNEVRNCSAGIHLNHTPKTVRENHIYGNDYGILVACSDEGSLIERNLINDNHFNGIRLDQTYVPMCSGPDLYQIKTTIRDNVIVRNGLGEGVPVFPASGGYEVGSGISMFVLDIEGACRVPPLPSAEIVAKVFNNLIADNLNGIILTCGSRPVIENNLVVRNLDYGVIVDNDASLRFDPAEVLNLKLPPPLYVGGPCTDPENPERWSGEAMPICFVDTIDAVLNMNTIDGASVLGTQDGVHLSTTPRHGFEPFNEPRIENTTITNFGGYGVSCDDVGTHYVEYSFPNTHGNAHGDYRNCPCVWGQDCQYFDPLFWSGYYPEELPGMEYANEYYLSYRRVCGAPSSSPLLDLIAGDPWYQKLPLPPLYTICDLSRGDTAWGDLWDLGFHYIEGNWLFRFQTE